MGQMDLLKVGAAGVGAYLLYQWAQGQGLFGGPVYVDKPGDCPESHTLVFSSVERRGKFACLKPLTCPAGQLAIPKADKDSFECSPPIPPGSSGVVVAASPPTPAPPPTTLTLMQARAALEPSVWLPTMSPHQWNWLYMAIRGGEAPAPPAGLPEKVTMQEWYDAMKPLGVSGLRAGYLSARRRRMR